jgi:large subunit ribosomal protein L7/L12
MRVTDNCPSCGAPVGDSTQCRYCGKAFQSAATTEQTEFQVILTGAPKNRMLGVIKVVWEISGGGWSLKEAKDLVDHAPRPVKQGVSREEAEDIIKKLKRAGAEAEIR